MRIEITIGEKNVVFGAIAADGVNDSDDTLQRLAKVVEWIRAFNHPTPKCQSDDASGT